MKHWGIDRVNQINRIMSQHRLLRRFAPKRIDTSDAVKKFYIEDGIAFISCNVSDYYDVIDHYSVKGYEWPNSNFLQFIEDNAYFIPTDYPLVLEICGTHFSERQQQTIESTIRDYYALKLGDANVEVANTRLKWTTLFVLTILSAIILVIYKMLFTQEGLLLEILLVIFWFYLWERGDVFAFERGMRLGWLQ